ncbi:MAG: UdgX family uracil-DNA binding protein [Acetobacter papayae]
MSALAESVLAHQVDFQGWRNAVRQHIAQDTPPEALHWRVAAFGEAIPETEDSSAALPASGQRLTLSRALLAMLEAAMQARDETRFTLGYRILYRLARHELDLNDEHDPDLMALRVLAESVREETRAFRERFSAFSADRSTACLHDSPTHYIIEANAAFCQARNPRLWEIRTPYRRALWNGQRLFFGPGENEAAHVQASVWQPAGQGCWQGYPQTVLLPALKDIEQADSLAALGALAMDCRACPSWENATRTVFGCGQGLFRLMLVGEQPGDQEDLAGMPFVGPAGQVLDKALAEAGFVREQIYVTNAVKHFGFTWRNGRRLHQKPDETAIHACHVWLEAERRVLNPALVVMLGATAARSMLKKPVTISRERSRIIPLDATTAGLVTVHPSYLLRLPDDSMRQKEYERFVADLKLARDYLHDKGLLEPQ